MAYASATIMSSDLSLPIQYASCSLVIIVLSVSRPTYVQVIQAGPTISITKDSGSNPSLHATESSKSPIDDDLEDYYI